MEYHNEANATSLSSSVDQAVARLGYC